MRCLKIFILACFALAASFPADAQEPQDWQHRAGLKSVKAYTQAEAILREQWKRLENEAAPERVTAYALDQLAWMMERQNQEVALIFNSTPRPEYANRVSRDGAVNSILCYTAVTVERAAKIGLLADQETSGRALTLAGKFGKSGDIFVFVPYPFAVPFELGRESDLTALAPELQAVITTEAEKIGDSKSLYNLTGFFRLPGVYRLDKSMKAEEITGGMAWREQDQYVEMPEPGE